jgi:nucleoside-diphosphate-sugar epimerase
MAALNLARQLGLRAAWLRVFSTFGPRDHPDTMVSYLIRTLLAGDRPRLTACEQVWDYLYVEDAAEAVYQVAVTPTAEGVFNLGSGHGVVLREFVEQARDLIDPGLPLGLGEVPYRPDQVMHLEVDVSRLAAAAGWQPTTSTADGLTRTIEWHRSATLGES